MSLRDIDVTDIAEDDEKLKQKYLEEVLQSIQPDHQN
jgi:hypothetical protein